MTWLSGTIKQRMMTYLIALAALFAVQFATTVWAEYGSHNSAAFQRLMNQVTAHQMYGDMKHDAIESDVLRIKDAAARHDPALLQGAKKALKEDIAALNETYRFVFEQNYPDALQAEVQKAVAPEHDYVAKAVIAGQRIEEHPEDFNGAVDSFISSFENFEHVQDVLAAAIKSSIEARNQQDDRIAEIVEVIQFVAMVLAGAGLVWTLRYTGHFVVGPLERLTGALGRMASGKYDEPIEGYDNGDEIADLARVAQVFRATALEKQKSDCEQVEVAAALRAAMSELAQKNLEYRIEANFPGSYAELKDDFNSAIGALCLAIGTVRVGASNLISSIVEIRSAADDLARRNELQAASIKASATAMGEVTKSVQQTAEHASSVKTAMAQTQQEATEGGTVVRDAIAAMAAIEKSTSEITQITDLIDGIAFQTNLLALNAGVEAARAGDAGKGFAVVANEVRALAQRSADAAKGIKELIGSSSVQVGSGVALVGQTGEKLLHIVDRVDKVTQSINEIADTAERQASSLRQVQAAVTEMDMMTQHNAAMAEETTAATGSLASEADELRTLVSQFQTRDAAARPSHVMNPARIRRTSIGGLSARSDGRPLVDVIKWQEDQTFSSFA